MILRGRDGAWDIFNMNLNVADILSCELSEEKEAGTAKAIEEIAKDIARDHGFKMHKEQSCPRLFTGSGVLYDSAVKKYLKLRRDEIKMVYSYLGSSIVPPENLPAECLASGVLPAFLQKSYTSDGFAHYDVPVYELGIMLGYKRGLRSSDFYKAALERFDELMVTPKKWEALRHDHVLLLEASMKP